MKVDCNITGNYLKEKGRMTYNCGISCSDCPLILNGELEYECTALQSFEPQKAIEIVQKWSDEHPQKTYLEDFLEKYPNAQIINGIPRFCPEFLGYKKPEKSCGISECEDCWNKPLEDAKGDNSNDR